MPQPGEHSCRIKDPNQYDRFARVNDEIEENGKNIDVIYGIKEGKSEIQALRYRKDEWTPAAAKRSCTEFEGTFEPAEELSEKIGINPIYLVLQEAKPKDKYQLILPIGVFHTRKYGKITITRKMAQDMVSHWKNRVLGERQPYIDTDHDFGEANGWIKDLQVRNEGLFARIEWTVSGIDKLQNKKYRYFSACIDEYMDIKTGKKYYPVLISVSLTNMPVMNTMPMAMLSQKKSAPESGVDDTAYNDSTTKDIQENEMDVKDFVKMFSELSDEDKEKIKEALNLTETDEGVITTGFTELATTGNFNIDNKVENVNCNELAEMEVLKSKVDMLEKANQQLTDQVLTVQKRELEKKKELVLNAALEDGKIIPKDKEVWENYFDKDPEGTTKLLSSLPKHELFTEKGTGSSGSENLKFTKDDKFFADRLGLTKEDYIKGGK
jgi:phage I-like protein